jgi:lipase chaperone LimK
LHHTWQVHNRYNDYFAQRRATKLEKKREENEKDTVVVAMNQPIINENHPTFRRGV